MMIMCKRVARVLVCTLVCAALCGHTPLIADPGVRRAFFSFVDAAFAQRRKFLKSTLAANSGGKVSREDVASALAEIGLDEKIRGEALSIERLIALFDTLGQPVLPTRRKAYED